MSTDYVTELEQALLETGRRRRHGSRARARLDIGGVVAAGSAALAIAIAVAAITLLGHRAARSAHPAARGPALLGTHPLISELAVLRRPQTAADQRLSDRYGYFPVGFGPIIPRLTRLVATLPARPYTLWGSPYEERIYLVVSRPETGTPRPYPADREDVVSFVDVSHTLDWGGGMTAAQLAGHRAVVWLSGGYAIAPVPDGRLGVWDASPARALQPLTPRVNDNVAVARVSTGGGGRVRLTYAR